MKHARTPQIKTISPAAGVRAALKDKATKRRETLEALAKIPVPASSGRNDISPDLEITYVPIDSLKAGARRVRRSEKVQNARLDASLRRFGLVQPILTDAEGKIVHGHGVWEAARRAGMDEVPTIVISHLTPAERRVLSIALNRLGETGEWDEQALKLEFKELIELDQDLVVTGFETPEIDFLILNEDGDDEGQDDDPLLMLRSKPVSRPGDVWQLNDHRLLQGDARDPENFDRLMLQNELVRAVLTDVPFNVPNRGHVTGQAHHREFAMAHGEMSREEFEAFNLAWMRACLKRLIDGGLLMTFIDWRSVELVLGCGRALELELLNLIVWAKSNGGQGSFWRSQHELLPVFKVGSEPHVNNVQLGRHGRWRSNLWSYPGASSLGSDSRSALGDHPTVKPRALLEDALLDISYRGDIVIDPFLGSGSTLLAAETTGRICRAIEIDGLYCDLAIRRWEAITGQQAVLLDTGETHHDVEIRRAIEGDPAVTGQEDR